MHELMIFFGTPGGIIMLGIMGMIIGPIVAALFITIWEIYGVAFQDILPQVEGLQSRTRPEENKGNHNE